MLFRSGAEGIKPKRVSLPRDLDPMTVDLQTAINLLALPREVGVHPETGQVILAGIGRFGPYLRHAGKYKSLESSADLLTIGVNRAVDLLAQPGRGARLGAPRPSREIGLHPDDGKLIAAGIGRYGPYVKHGAIYANLPKGRTIEEVTLDEAVALIAERAARKGGRKAKSAKTPKVVKAADAGSKTPRARAKRPSKGKSRKSVAKAPLDASGAG